MFFWLRERKKSLEEILFKMLLRKKYCGFAVYLQIKSLTKIIDKNALFLRVLPWARETIGLSARFCLCIKILKIIFIQVSQLRELIEVKEVITSYGRSGS